MSFSYHSEFPLYLPLRLSQLEKDRSNKVQGYLLLHVDKNMDTNDSAEDKAFSELLNSV